MYKVILKCFLVIVCCYQYSFGSSFESEIKSMNLSLSCIQYLKDISSNSKSLNQFNTLAINNKNSKLTDVLKRCVENITYEDIKDIENYQKSIKELIDEGKYSNSDITCTEISNKKYISKDICENIENSYKDIISLSNEKIIIPSNNILNKYNNTVFKSYSYVAPRSSLVDQNNLLLEYTNSIKSINDLLELENILKDIKDNNSLSSEDKDNLKSVIKQRFKDLAIVILYNRYNYQGESIYYYTNAKYAKYQDNNFTFYDNLNFSQELTYNNFVIKSLEVKSGYEFLIYKNQNCINSYYKKYQNNRLEIEDEINCIKIQKLDNLETNYQFALYQNEQFNSRTIFFMDILDKNINNETLIKNGENYDFEYYTYFTIAQNAFNEGYRLYTYNSNDCSHSSILKEYPNSTGNTDFNNSVKCIKLKKDNNNYTLKIYPKTNYEYFNLYKKYTYNTTTDNIYKISNDEIKSLKIEYGYKVELYSKYHNNECLGDKVSEFVEDNDIIDIKDDVGCLKIEKRPFLLKIYDEENYAGNHIEHYDFNKSYELKDFNITSLKIKHGYKVNLYSEYSTNGCSDNKIEYTENTISINISGVKCIQIEKRVGKVSYKDTKTNTYYYLYDENENAGNLNSNYKIEYLEDGYEIETYTTLTCTEGIDSRLNKGNTFNDSIKCIKIVKIVEPILTLYSNYDFTGSIKKIYEKDYPITEPSPKKYSKNYSPTFSFKSVKIDSRYKVQVSKTRVLDGSVNTKYRLSKASNRFILFNKPLFILDTSPLGHFPCLDFIFYCLYELGTYQQPVKDYLIQLYDDIGDSGSYTISTLGNIPIYNRDTFRSKFSSDLINVKHTYGDLKNGHKTYKLTFVTGFRIIPFLYLINGDSLSNFDKDSYISHHMFSYYIKSIKTEYLGDFFD